MYLSRLAFLVSFTDPNKKIFIVKSVFKYFGLNCGFSLQKIYRFITVLRIEILLFIKQCSLKFMSGNKWWSAKFDPKLLSDLVMILILSSYIPLDFHESIPVVPLKYLMYFLAGINTK